MIVSHPTGTNMTDDYRLLRVDLTTGEWRSDHVPDQLMAGTIGGKGLASRYMLDEIPARCDPLGRASKLMFVLGPLSGTSFPTGNRYGVLFKSPLTGTYAENYSGGVVAKHMRATGHVAFVISGVSEQLSYLHVTEHGIEVMDARPLAGMDAIEVQARLLATHPGAGVLCIGPAGENLVRIASIQNDKYHSAARCGSGAVMGSKRLKAIVFSGTAKPAIGRDPAFKQLVADALRRLKEQPLFYGPEGMYRLYGTPVITDWANELGCFPTRYYTSGFSENAARLNGKALAETILKRRTGCWNCPFTCSKLVEVASGPNKCEVEGPEYETIANFGGLCDLPDLEGVAMLNEYCDRAGIDTISAGALCALAIEAKRRGMIEALQGTSLDYGDPAPVLAFLKDMVAMNGIASDFAMGTKHVAAKHGLGSLAVHVKGLDFAGYDPRAFRGFALSYGVAPEGPTHLRSVYHGIERQSPHRASYEDKVLPMIEQEDKMAIIDSLVTCKFIRNILDWDFLARIHDVVYTSSIDVPGLRAIAAEMVTNSRRFNVREGFGREDDFMPDRFYREALPTRDGGSHELDRARYARMLDEYYAARGWSPDGVPPA